MNALAMYDADAKCFPSSVPEKIQPASRIPNGFYTLTFPDGSHKTFRISTQPEDSKFAPGKRVFSILVGPDNSADYEKSGFVDDHGITVWKSKRGGKLEQYAMLVWSLATGEQIDGYELMVSRRCLRCNRPLTDPDSIERGLGPTCWGLAGGGE